MTKFIIFSLLVLSLHFRGNEGEQIRRAWHYKVYSIETIGLLYFNNVPLTVLVPRRGVNE